MSDSSANILTRKGQILQGRVNKRGASTERVNIWKEIERKIKQLEVALNLRQSYQYKP